MPVWGAWVGVLVTVGWGAVLVEELPATGWLAVLVEVAVHPAATTAITARRKRAGRRGDRLSRESRTMTAGYDDHRAQVGSGGP